MDSKAKSALTRKGFLQTSLLASVVLLVPKSGMRAANTYYVSNAGDDRSSGTLLNPWKSIARVNAARLSPGDVVLFHSGETFTGGLIPRNSGDDSLDIAYAYYGAGNRPVIDGSASSALYIANELFHHLRFEGLDFAGSVGEGMPTVRCYTHDVSFIDCIMRDSRHYNGFSAWSNSGAGIYNVRLDSCEVYANYAQGIFIGSETGTNGPHDCLIDNCQAHHNGHEVYHDHGIYAKFGVKVRNNTCHSNPAGAGIKVNCEGVHDSPYAPRVEGNSVFGNMLGLYSVHESTVCINNLVYNNQIANLELDSDTSRSTLMFNTFANVSQGKTNRAVNIAGTPQRNRLKNNLLIQDQLTTQAELFRASGVSGLEDFVRNNELDYNLLYTDGVPSTELIHDDGGALGWWAWQQLMGSPDQHSTFLETPPEVIERYSDLHPLKGGNLKGRGIATEYSYDKDGVLRSFPPTPGCYE
jgi:hypothetical protein